MVKTRTFFILAGVLIAVVPGRASGNLFTDIGKQLENLLAAIKNPIETGVISAVNSQCSTVKRLTGVSYEEVDGAKEPDTSQLTLDFICNSFNVTYNLSTAAEDILAAANFNPSQKLYVFLHGFTDDPTQASFTTVREALFDAEQCNVLALDASSLIRYLYLRSSTYVIFIGEKLGQVLAAMLKNGVKAEAIHLIGHSLGAHIGSFAGKTFTNLTQQKLGRISGLDPAGPCFANLDKDYRLNSTDANFVDVIHTDAGVLGINKACGHVDYWPEGGSDQPNCFSQTCSHSRAWKLFAESVTNQTSFPAVQCESWSDFKKGNCNDTQSFMGFGSNCSATDQFYLRTRGEAPYGLGQDGTTYDEEEGTIRRAISNITRQIFG